MDTTTKRKMLIIKKEKKKELVNIWREKKEDKIRCYYTGHERDCKTFFSQGRPERDRTKKQKKQKKDQVKLLTDDT